MSFLEIYLHNWRSFTEKKFKIPIEPLILRDLNGSGKTSLISGIYSLFTKEPWPETKWLHHLKSGTSFFGLSTQFTEWFLAGQKIGQRLVVKNSFPQSLNLSKTDNFQKNNSNLDKVDEKTQQNLSIQNYQVLTYLPIDNYWLNQGRSQKLKILDEILAQIYGEVYRQKIKNLQKLVFSKQQIIKLWQINENQKTTNFLLAQSFSKEIYKLSLEIWKFRAQFWQKLKEQILEFNTWIEQNFQSQSLEWLVSFFDGNKKKVQEIESFNSDYFFEFMFHKHKQNISNLDTDKIWFNLWQKEVLAKKVLFGAHRDDFEIKFNNLPAQHFLSRGEMRLFIIFLKNLGKQLIEINNTELKVIWLVDDLFNELDSKREQILLTKVLAQSFWCLATSTRTINLDMFNYYLKDLQI